MKANQWQAMAVAAGLMVSTSALAQSTGGGSGAFGNAGQIVVSSDASANLGYTTEGAGYGFFNLAPSVDYFLKENLSIGSGVNLAVVFGDGDTAAAFGINARVGYNISLTEKVSVWPKAIVTLFVGDNILSLPDGTGSASTVILEGYAPFLYHVTSHFFVGAGPRLAFGLGDDVDVTFSVGTTVGGYF
ncbi:MULTISPECIES: hypothetical protein [Myxococcus]|uniref:Outer membrane protein beta-barrel domain-containing protein n=1 Tax=Myxococcus llanfairpwllgwyngyllgogerychwyrndrobwllllantysiliogogogochensis TaxID=2590453 RepID=A0A540WMM2_9BACT|nr:MULTISPECIES: hypothetical protein [Myxococcus]NTX08828.1 hypothetical protein [Myxococcus sp. CA040A]NTX40748.1 hypothetical protein [Myxococcus sp. CA033]TQF10268.1 hypothetical protein FJV41_40290 [Myxococcus llanfairpwllgwyngyllgogerychwyrndrobwllllantysiliogogogochensis]